MADSQISMQQSNTRRRRITRACDYCHQRSIRCRPSSDNQSCQNCRDFAQECTYHRKPRRRGKKPHGHSPPDHEENAREADTVAIRTAGQRINTSQRNAEPEPQTAHVNAEYWRAPYVASQANIMDLVEIYFEVVYPIFPFFHQPTFVRSISRAEHTSKRTLFVVTMALCALVSSRVRDGSVTNPKWDLQSLQETDPESFYNEAKKQLLDLTAQSDVNILRAHAILAVAAIQNGKIRDMHQHLGAYHTLVAMDGLHDESNWPRNIGIVEQEERRRLVRLS